MTRGDLQQLSRLRQKEARLLLNSQYYPGAYYLIGYSVECALKACIAKQIRRFEFPDKDLASKSYVHDLKQLLKLAGLEPVLNHDSDESQSLALNWAVAKDWSVQSRYEVNIGPQLARDMYAACVSQNGILRWIRTKW